LQHTTGLRLPATIVFDHPTAADLTGRLHALLAEVKIETAARPEPVAATNGADEADRFDLKSIFTRLCREDRHADALNLVTRISAVAPQFERIGERVRLGTVFLARGDTATRLICFPAFAAMSGPHEYARFAARYRNRRDVIALQYPGFLPGTDLPASIEVLADLLATAIAERFGDEPVALLGHSSGGLVAQATAERMEERGNVVDRLFLLDVYLPGMAPIVNIGKSMMDNFVSRDGDIVPITNRSLVVMGGYFRIFTNWRPRPVKTHTVFVRARAALPESDTRERWRPGWDLPHTPIDVPGDHFTMMGEHADDTARILEDEFLRSMPDATSES
jgi:thioesterase domain-containing protein